MRVAFIIFLLLHVKEESADEDPNQMSSSDENNNLDIFSKCYDNLGCIDTDARWYDKENRPVNFRPVDRHVIKTDILLLKPSREEADNLLYTSIVARKKNLKASAFDFKADLMILIHDFTANGYTGWIKHIAYTVFTKAMAINVVSIDWQRGAEPPYDQAIANARVVALEIIQFIRQLKDKFKYSVNDIHLVGHGVGAHIAGYVGASIEGIKKITALDPSGPRFEGMPDVVKLNPTNARYVEVIHTDAYDFRSQGTKEPMGHSDFYVNYANVQLGCPMNKTFGDVLSVDKSSLTQGEILPGCNHKRSFKYFIEAFGNEKCTFLGIHCDSVQNFSMGRCVSCGNSEGDCRIFGRKSYKNSQQKNTYYFNVAERPPFCMFQYKVDIIVNENNKKLTGYFDMILLDEEGHVSEATLATESRFRVINGGSNIFIYYAQPPKLGSITEVKVRWTQQKKFYCFIYCNLKINVERMNLMLLETNNIRNRSTYTLCPADGGTSIENGTFKKFAQCSVASKGNTGTGTMTATASTIYQKFVNVTLQKEDNTNCLTETTIKTEAAHPLKNIEPKHTQQDNGVAKLNLG